MTTPTPSTAEQARSLIARAGTIEKIMYASIIRAVTRRPAVQPGGTGHSYKSPVLTILWIFIVLSAVELVIVDMIVNRWIIVRIVFLVISIWGLIWMTGLMCSYFMRPHVVGPKGIDIRDGLDLDLRIPWSAIHSVGIATHTWDEKPPRIQREPENGDARTLFVQHILNSTNIEVTLERPTALILPGIHPKGGEHSVDVIRFWVDDPSHFLEAARPFMQ